MATILRFLVDMNASSATRAIDGIRGRIGDLDRNLARTRELDISDKQAAAALIRTQLKADRLREKLKMDLTIEGAAKAEAQLLGLEHSAGRLNRQLEKTSLLTRLAGAGAVRPSGLGALAGLAPLAIPLGAAALGGGALAAVSLGAAAAAAAAFGLVARTAYTQASTAAQAVAKAQDAYTVAIQHGTKASTAYQTEQKAIATAYQDMSPRQIALSRQVGAMSDAWKSVQKSIAPVISGALTPWLGVVTQAMKVIRPLITPVADVFAAWGQSLDRYFTSSKGSKTIHDIAVAVGQFAAIQLNDVITFIKDLGTGIVNLARDIGGAHVQYGAFGGYLVKWGDAFAAWSKSKQARDDVSAFVRYVRDNGHLLVSIAGDLAKFIPGIFAGATAAGTLELKTLSTFLGWLAKLPPSWAKPLTEAAGALLLLSKTGVLRIGIQVVGAAARFLYGGTLALSGATAAGEMEAAMRTGGAAAAAEIRAAMAGGGAVAGGESAAGAGEGAAAGGLFARLGWTRAALTGILRAPLAAAAGAAAAWAVGHLVTAFVPPATARLKTAYQQATPGIAQAIEGFLLGGKAPVINDAITRFQNMIKHGFAVAWQGAVDATAAAQQAIRRPLDVMRHDAAGAFDGIRHGIAGIGHSVAGGFDAVRRVFAVIGHSIADTFDRVRHFQGQFDAFGKDVALVRHWITDAFDGIRHGGAITFDFLRHLVAATWDAIRHGTATSLAGLRHSIADAFDAIRHGIAAVFDGIRHGIASAWDAIFRNSNSQTRNGLNSIVNWFKGLPGRVIGALFGLGHRLYAFGRAALSEFWNGLKSVAGSIFSWVGNFVSTIWNKVKRFFGISSPSSLFYDIGKNLMLGLFHGIRDNAHHAAAAAQSAAHRVSAAGSGVQRWAGLVRKALAMEGLSQGLAGNVLYQMSTESGGNPNAINLSDINAAQGDPSRGLMQVIGSTFAAYHWPGTSGNIYDPLANIAAALNYARHVYGPSLMRGGMGIGSGHGYGFGTSSAAPGWAWVGERGPELVRFRGGEQVTPAGRGTGTPAGQPQKIILELRAGPGDRYGSFLLDEIKRLVNVHGGGDVGLAFGQSY